MFITAAAAEATDAFVRWYNAPTNDGVTTAGCTAAVETEAHAEKMSETNNKNRKFIELNKQR